MVENAPVPKMLRVWLAGAILAVGILFVFVVFQATRMSELGDVRAMDLAQVARNMAEGRGFTTNFIRPLSLAQIPRVENHPDLMHAPLQPWLMSLLFRAFGPSTKAISWSSGLPYLLTVPLIFWLGMHLFSRKVGMLAAGILTTNVGMLAAAASGTESALLGFIFTLICVLMVLYQQRSAQRLPLAAAAGALTGCLYLTHHLWALALVGVLLMAYLSSSSKQRVGQMLIVLIAYAIVCLPWVFRTYRLTGNPFFNLTAYETIVNTRTFSGNLIYRAYEASPPGVLSFMFSAPREIYERARDAAVNLYPVLFALAGSVVMPFFLVAALVPIGQAAVDRLRPGLYVIAILIFVGLCLTIPDARLLMPLAPIITIIAAAFFYQLLDLRIRPLTERLRVRWTTIAVTLLMVAHLIPLFLQLAPGRPMTPVVPLAVRRASQELNALIPQLSGHEQSPAVVLTDMPWAVAWYANRPAIWLPRTDIDMRRMEQSIGHIRWLVLTPQIAEVAQEERATGWAELWRRGLMRVPTMGGWRPRQVFANGNWVLFERVPDVASVGTLPPATQ